MRLARRLVSRQSAVDFCGPGIDSASNVGDRFEALLRQETRDPGAASSRVTQNCDRPGAIKFPEPLRYLSHWNMQAAVYAGDIPFPAFANVQQLPLRVVALAVQVFAWSDVLVHSLFHLDPARAGGRFVLFNSDAWENDTVPSRRVTR